MKNKIKIAMLGGDRRQLMSLDKLSERYGEINIWGIGESYLSEHKGAVLFDDPYECIDGCNVVLLPLPASTDSKYLSCPLFEGKDRLKLSALAQKLSKGCTVIGGRLPEDFAREAGESGARIEDYFLSEVFQIKNAYATAEAAVSIAMNTLDKNIRGSSIAITGYGRIAKHLARLLTSLGARVTVTARNEKELAWAEHLDCRTLVLDSAKASLKELLRGYDVIYNTVPSWLFDREYLEKLDKRTLLVDLASAPGGVDIRAAKEIGANVNWATSLPGKYAPRSAGELIAECVIKIISEEVSSP